MFVFSVVVRRLRAFLKSVGWFYIDASLHVAAVVTALALLTQLFLG